MNSIHKAITARLAEAKAAAYLRKCKAATAAALAAIAEEAEATGVDPQAVLAQHLGKTPTRAEARRSQTEAERALALLRGSKTTTTSTAKPAAASTPAKAAPAKPAAKPATAASPSPYASAPTDHLVALVRRKYLSGTDLDRAEAELARRGVKIHRSGYTISNKNTQ